jgi:phage terminase large subunit-like protein
VTDGPLPTRDGYFFDLEKAFRALDFIEELRQWKGPHAGKPLKLLPWQHELVCELFGCVDDAGLRQYGSGIGRSGGLADWLRGQISGK